MVREILVPSDISLHKLNYAIQRSFGWQNSHLHQFILPSKVFAELTDGKYVGEEDELFYAQNGNFMKWAEYCGTYFRFPTEDMNDLYWDDDYNGELSIKSWLKRKYNGYNNYNGYSEHFVIAKKKVESFIDEFPFLNVDTYFSEPKTQRGKRGNIIRKPISEATVAEVGLQIGELGSLLERLPLNEVLRAKGDKKTTKSLLATMMKERNKLYESCCDKYVDMNKGITSSRFGLPWSEDNVPVLPITDEIFYQYDFGDGWGVKITCVEQYYTKDRLDDAGDQFVAVSLDDQAWLDETRVYNHKNEQIIGEEREMIVKAGLLRKLTCTYADGLSVFDDVGGIYGFADFLIVAVRHDLSGYLSALFFQCGFIFGRFDTPQFVAILLPHTFELVYLLIDLILIIMKIGLSDDMMLAEELRSLGDLIQVLPDGSEFRRDRDIVFDLDIRSARDGQPVLQQLRTVSVPGEADPPDDHQRAER